MADLAVRRIFNKSLFRLFILTKDICRTGFDANAAANAALYSIYDHEFLS